MSDFDFYYERAPFCDVSILCTVENVGVQASTVPSLTIAMARFLARASLRSSTLVSSMSSSWNHRSSMVDLSNCAYRQTAGSIYSWGNDSVLHPFA